MKKIIVLVAALFATATMFAQQDRKDRIIVSYLIAFGDEPKQAEIDYWMTDSLSLRSVSALVAKHKQNTRYDPNLRTRIVNNSYLSAFGRYPEPSEFEYWKNEQQSKNLTFTEIYTSHKKYLTDYRDDWRKVIEFSYLQCMNRKARTDEVNYWMNQREVQTFAEIKVHHSRNRKYEPEWNRIDNNKTAVKMIKLSPTAKAETKLTLNNIVPQAAGVISTGGLNCISTGGLNCISTGGLN